MKFLTVLIIVFIYRNWVGGHPLRDRVPVRPYLLWFINSSFSVNLRYFLCVGLPVVIVFAITLKLHGWLLSLLWFAIAMAVMLYAVDVYDEDRIFGDHDEWLRSQGGDVDTATLRRRQEDFVLVTTYEIFQGIYPALFWFLLFGPAGALAYVLSRQYLDALDDDDPELDMVERAVYFLEWPAARITGLLFALLGHFGRCFEKWLASLGDVSESIGSLLSGLAQVAVDAPPAGAEDNAAAYESAAIEVNDQLHSLMDRTLFGWLGVATIVAILGI